MRTFDVPLNDFEDAVLEDLKTAARRLATAYPRRPATLPSRNSTRFFSQ